MRRLIWWFQIVIFFSHLSSLGGMQTKAGQAGYAWPAPLPVITESSFGNIGRRVRLGIVTDHSHGLGPARLREPGASTPNAQAARSPSARCPIDCRNSAARSVLTAPRLICSQRAPAKNL